MQSGSQPVALNFTTVQNPVQSTRQLVVPVVFHGEWKQAVVRTTYEEEFGWQEQKAGPTVAVEGRVVVFDGGSLERSEIVMWEEAMALALQKTRTQPIE